jgi:hypothetical protein
MRHEPAHVDQHVADHVRVIDKAQAKENTATGWSS